MFIEHVGACSLCSGDECESERELLSGRQSGDLFRTTRSHLLCTGLTATERSPDKPATLISCLWLQDEAFPGRCTSTTRLLPVLCSGSKLCLFSFLVVVGFCFVLFLF